MRVGNVLVVSGSALVRQDAERLTPEDILIGKERRNQRIVRGCGTLRESAVKSAKYIVISEVQLHCILFTNSLFKIDRSSRMSRQDTRNRGFGQLLNLSRVVLVSSFGALPSVRNGVS